MKLLIISGLLVVLAIFDPVDADGQAIVKAAKSQIGVPYSWEGGDWRGKSKGTGPDGADIVGLDCSGLIQYAVYKGTGKKIQRWVRNQYKDRQCRHYPYDQHKLGDLVFYRNATGDIGHVGVISGNGLLIHSPHPGGQVEQVKIWPSRRDNEVARCW